MSPPTAFSYRQATFRTTLPVGIRRPSIWQRPAAFWLCPPTMILHSSFSRSVGFAMDVLLGLLLPRDSRCAYVGVREDADPATGLPPMMPLPALLRSCTRGADAIVQACLEDGPWRGARDVLLKVAAPSPLLGDWSYEVVDAKLPERPKVAR